MTTLSNKHLLTLSALRDVALRDGKVEYRSSTGSIFIETSHDCAAAILVKDGVLRTRLAMRGYLSALGKCEMYLGLDRFSTGMVLATREMIETIPQLKEIVRRLEGAKHE